jgi:hypothetical protein
LAFVADSPFFYIKKTRIFYGAKLIFSSFATFFGLTIFWSGAKQRFCFSGCRSVWDQTARIGVPILMAADKPCTQLQLSLKASPYIVTTLWHIVDTCSNSKHRLLLATSSLTKKGQQITCSRNRLWSLQDYFTPAGSMLCQEFTLDLSIRSKYNLETITLIPPCEACHDATKVFNSY